MGKQKLIGVSNGIVRMKNEIQTDIFNGGTSEFFINMNPKDIPPKDHPDRGDFVRREKQKCREGINIGGVTIPGRLYYHLNFHKIALDILDEKINKVERVITNPYLRDNEWILFNAYEQAVKSKKAIAIGGSRQISKSEFICSSALYEINIFKNTEGLMLFTNDPDKQTFVKKTQLAIANGETFIQKPLIDNNWKNTEIRFGTVNKDNSTDVKARLFLYNTASDNASEIGTGKTLSFFAYEEIAKNNMRASYEAVIPALITPYGLRCSPILVFCVCEGTKVWTNNGALKNIEDLQIEDGIIGYNSQSKSYSKEEITYWQQPIEKQCVRITTNSGRNLECSIDHPILSRDRHQCKILKRTLSFKDSTKLEVGDYIACTNQITEWGSKTMQDPRLIGWLVGDGSYCCSEKESTNKKGIVTITSSCGARLTNADPEIWKYIEAKYEVKDYSTPTLTKDGRMLRKAGVNGVVPELRKLGIAGQTKDRKRLPEDIHSYTKEDVCEFLGGYFDADGCVYIGKGKGANFEQCLIKVSSANIEILKETQLLLLKLGIHSKLVYCIPNFDNPKTTRGHYNLNIYERDSLIGFYNSIYFVVRQKQEKLERMYDLLMQNPTKQEVFKLEGLNLEKIINIEDIGVRKVYNLTANNTNTYVANGFITHNTGGNVEKSKDAEDLFLNPEAARVCEFENEGKKTGLFVGGWYRQDFKNKIPFTQYLKNQNLHVEEGTELDKMEILVTDFTLANKVLDKEQEDAKKSKDPTAYLKHKMYFPRSLKEMFTKNNASHFRSEYINQQLEFIKAGGVDITAVELFRDLRNGDVKHKLSSKPFIHDWKNPGYALDAPVKIFDFPKYTSYGVHVIGVDSIRSDQVGSSVSLAYATVLRRLHSDFEDPFRGKQVASYLGRPRTVKEFHQMLLDLAEWYNAQILYEHTDRDLLTFFENKHKAHLLLDTIPLQREIKVNTQAKNTKGLIASQPNMKFLLTSAIGWVEDDMEDGTLGYAKLFDDILLQQLEAYDPDENLDAYIGFSHAVAAYNYFEKFGTPVVTLNNKVEEKKKTSTPIKNAFGMNFKHKPKNAFGL